MLNPGHHLPLSRAVAGELVRDHDARRPHPLLQQLAQQLLSGLLVAAPLHQDVEHHSGLVHSSRRTLSTTAGPDRVPPMRQLINCRPFYSVHPALGALAAESNDIVDSERKRPDPEGPKNSPNG